MGREHSIKYNSIKDKWTSSERWIEIKPDLPLCGIHRPHQEAPEFISHKWTSPKQGNKNTKVKGAMLRKWNIMEKTATSCQLLH